MNASCCGGGGCGGRNNPRPDLDENPLESDLDPAHDETGVPTDECPHCGEEIYSGTPSCPKCGGAMIEKPRTATQSGWITLTAFLLLFATAWWLLTYF